LFALGGLVALLALRKAVRQRPKFLSATLAELRKDEKELGDERSRGHPAEARAPGR